MNSCTKQTVVMLALLVGLFVSNASAHATALNSVSAPTVTIAPHRASYKMTLTSARNSSSIRNVTGTMTFDWGDACDGWAIQQRMQLVFMPVEGDETQVTTQVATWEAKNGQRFRFNVRRLRDEKEDEVFKGHAERDQESVRAHYDYPQGMADKTYSADTLFPSAHTIMILEKAIKGEKLFSRRVFDGSDEDGAGDISAFMGTRQDEPSSDGVSPEIKSNPLFAGPVWPVRLAFFKPDSETGMPDYEMDLVLQANGVARSMTIDYGDFVVVGKLTKLEPSTHTICN